MKYQASKQSNLHMAKCSEKTGVLKLPCIFSLLYYIEIPVEESYLFTTNAICKNCCLLGEQTKYSTKSHTLCVERTFQINVLSTQASFE